MIKELHRRAALGLVGLPGPGKTLIALGCDLLLLVLVAATVARTSGVEMFAVCAPLFTVLALLSLGTYRALIRFVANDHFLRLIAGSAFGGLLATLVVSPLSEASIGWMEGLLYISGSATLLILCRCVAAALLMPARSPARTQDRAVIFGAGSAGVQLAAALQASGRLQPVAFADDRPDIQGRTVLGLPVLAPAALAGLRRRRGFEVVLLAIPSLKGVRRRQLLERLAQLSVRVMVMPSLGELASGRHRMDELHDVEVEDLLSRESVAPNELLLRRHITGRTVMVTGAAGSIGSELCRLALDHGAAKLVLLDHSEFGLYALHQELRARAASGRCELALALGSVTDDDHVRRVIRQERVDSVYHAAAYKHVPLVEQNVLAAVANNVFGTAVAALAAIECGAQNFVLVSTDKAVRPTSVMGASKRICELVVQALAARGGDTAMSIVRFGNVLASSGSVIPLFRQQIREGGPVTVTHPHATRYFMTIGEAAQLVIQAGALGKNGEIFALDTGEPITILELAERMIRLSGLEVRSASNPRGDIEIQITGLRPGEKLHEELVTGGRSESTVHPRIFRADASFLRWEEMEMRLQALRIAITNGDVAHVTQLVHQLAHEDWERSRALPKSLTPAFEPEPALQLATK